MDKLMKNALNRFAAMAIAVAAAVLLAAAFAQPASANTALNDDASLQLTSTMTAQAAKQKVWIITECAITSPDQGQLTYTYAFTYKNGLISKNSSAIIDSGGQKTSSVSSYSYNSKGDYRKWTEKWKYPNSSSWETTKHALSFDSKKRVASIDGGAVAYNSKGYCKMFESSPYAEYTYNRKGLMSKSSMPQNARSTTKYTRNAKGDLKSWRTTNIVESSANKATYDTSYKNGCLSSWKQTKTMVFNGTPYTTTHNGKYTWKKISVPKKLAAKVKAQQRWIVDMTMTDRPERLYPVLVVNK